MKYPNWYIGLRNEPIHNMPRLDMAATVQSQYRALREKDSALLAARAARRVDFENRVISALSER